jgi:hypothetical protein
LRERGPKGRCSSFKAISGGKNHCKVKEHGDKGNHEQPKRDRNHVEGSMEMGGIEDTCEGTTNDESTEG